MTILGAFVALMPTLIAGAATPQEPAYVSFCEVVKNPEVYDQREILTAGIIEAGWEMAVFPDPSCRPDDGHDYSTLPVIEGKGSKKLDRLLERRSRLDVGRAFVLVRARFDASNRYTGPLPADPKLQEILTKGNSRFGHMGFARFRRLRISSVEYAAPVDESARK